MFLMSIRNKKEHSESITLNYKRFNFVNALCQLPQPFKCFHV